MITRITILLCKVYYNVQYINCLVLYLTNKIFFLYFILGNFNIFNARGSVLRCTLFKQSFVLGEDIVIIFDFTRASVPCVQFSVMLQSEEILGLPPAPPSRPIVAEAATADTSASPDSPSPSNSKLETTIADTNQRGLIVTHEERQCSCLSLQTTQISLHVPPTVTSTFGTDHVQLRWRLHFEFVVLMRPLPPAPRQVQSRAVYWTPWDDQQGYETMSWDLPIKVYPSNPCLFAQAGTQCVTRV